MAYNAADTVNRYVLCGSHDRGRHRDRELDSAFNSWQLFSDKEQTVRGDIFRHSLHLALVGLEPDRESHRKTYRGANRILPSRHLPLRHNPSSSKTSLN